jgi:hypothetical protein
MDGVQAARQAGQPCRAKLFQEPVRDAGAPLQSGGKKEGHGKEKLEGENLCGVEQGNHGFEGAAPLRLKYFAIKASIENAPGPKTKTMTTAKRN